MTTLGERIKERRKLEDGIVNLIIARDKAVDIMLNN